MFQESVAVSFSWARSITGTSRGQSVVTDPSGNVYLAGDFNGVADFDPGPGTYNVTSAGNDIYIIKLNASGVFQWAYQIGGSGVDANVKLAYCPLGLIVTGSFSGTVDFLSGPGTLNLTSSGFADIFLMRLTASGMLVWVYKFGSTADDIPADLACDAAGDVYLTGNFQGTVNFDIAGWPANARTALANDAFLLKVNSSAGLFLWVRTISSSGNEFSISVEVSAGAQVYWAGTFTGSVDIDPGPAVNTVASAGSRDIFLIALQSNGTTNWSYRFGNSYFDFPVKLSSDPSNNVFLCGHFTGTIDFDPGPGTESLTSPFPYQDIFVLKLNPAGIFQFVRQIGGGLGSQAAGGMDVGPDGAIYLTGYLSGTADVDPGPGSVLVNPGAGDVFLLKLNSLGNLSWFNIFASPGVTDIGYGVEVNSLNRIHLAGVFSTTTDFDPGPSVFNMTNVTGWNAFLLQLNQAVPLPLDWLSFDAKYSDNQVQLVWTTANEKDNTGFDVLRSVDLNEWQQLAFIPSYGNNPGISTYACADPKPTGQLTYYKLRQTDFNGDMSYSPVVAVECDATNSPVVVFPNPVQDKIWISGLSYDKPLRRILTRGTDGRFLMELKSLDARYQFYTGDLPAGVCFLTIEYQDGTTFQCRIVKQ